MADGQRGTPVAGRTVAPHLHIHRHQQPQDEQRIRFLAAHDVLTDLPNCSLCTERLRWAPQQASRSWQKVAVMSIDLDRFEDVNDSLGQTHAANGAGFRRP